MQLDLRTIFVEEGSAFVVEDDVDLSTIKAWGRHPFSQPVRVRAEAVNTAGVVTLTLSASFSVTLCCDRCLTQFQRRFAPRFEHTVVQRLYGEDDGSLIVAPEGRLDAGELFAADLQLDLPSKVLCREDCRGLCPICGRNLNEGDCGCCRRETDPRLQILDSFFSN